MNEKIFKTLGQIGASGIVVGIITVIVGVSVGVVSIVSGARALKLKRENNDLKMVGTGLHTGSLKCIIGNIKAKRMETRITRVFFKYALREKGWERNE